MMMEMKSKGMELHHPWNSSSSLLENPQVFYKKLGEFHESAGLSIVCGAASSVLDLYLFYKLVAIRGGFTQVTKDGKWFEIASALNFSDRSPQPSFLLQNLYANLLLQFELINSLDEQKRLLPSGSYLESTPIMETFSDDFSNSGDSAIEEREYRPNFHHPYKALDDPGIQEGNRVSGVIEHEIDCGYLISVAVGAEQLNGLLYEIKDSSAKQFAAVPSLMDGIYMDYSDYEPVGLQVLVKSKKQDSTMTSLCNEELRYEPTLESSSKDESKTKPTVKSTKEKEKKDHKTPTTKATATCSRKKEKKDQEAPTGSRSAYQLFLVMECDRLKKQHGKKLKNVRQMALDAWKCLPESDRLPYIEESKKDKERFKQEMIAYSEQKGTRSGSTEFRVSNSEASMYGFHKDYHDPVKLDETDRLVRQDGSMVGLSAEMMEQVVELDAKMQMELDDQFGSAS